MIVICTDNNDRIIGIDADSVIALEEVRGASDYKTYIRLIDKMEYWVKEDVRAIMKLLNEDEF